MVVLIGGRRDAEALAQSILEQDLVAGAAADLALGGGRRERRTGHHRHEAHHCLAVGRERVTVEVARRGVTPLADRRIERRRVGTERGVEPGVVALCHEHIVVAGLPAEQHRGLEQVRVAARRDDAPLLTEQRHERAIDVGRGRVRGTERVARQRHAGARVVVLGHREEVERRRRAGARERIGLRRRLHAVRQARVRVQVAVVARVAEVRVQQRARGRRRAGVIRDATRVRDLVGRLQREVPRRVGRQPEHEQRLG